MALLLPAAAAQAQGLPRLHITALGLHSDQRVVRPGQTFHVTVHVHVREKRDRLDELVLPSLTNAVDLGDERKRVPATDGTDFYETLTVAASTLGTASFTPAYIDAIDPATGHGMRYSSQPLNVRVADVVPAPKATPGYDMLRSFVPVMAVGFVILGIGAVVLFAGGMIVALINLRHPGFATKPLFTQPSSERKTDVLREASAAYRARGDDASLDVLRNVLFARAGAPPGATFSDALRVLGSRDPHLARLMAVAERARFGPAHDRAPAARDLLALLDEYQPDREPVA